MFSQSRFVPIALALLMSASLAVASPAVGAQSAPSSQHIAENAGTSVPVYDTAWQMFVLASPEEADQYFATLEEYGFTGTWAGLIHHAPATYAHEFNGGGTVAQVDSDGNVAFTPEYIEHVNMILDAADTYGRKVGIVAAWQNLYLPGGGIHEGDSESDAVRGTVHEDNAYAYGQQMVEEFGSHPAVSMWIFGGDAGTNNTDENKQVWRNMANGVRDAGSTLDITYHTPTSHFDQLNYAGEQWLNFISPETGHSQTADETELELLAAADAYQLPVWQGEPRYFNIIGDWIPEEFRSPGLEEVEADAVAARNAGVAGYVYGDAGRWNWCRGWGDTSPCEPHEIAQSFGRAEQAVIDVFREQAAEAVTRTDANQVEPVDAEPVFDALLVPVDEVDAQDDESLPDLNEIVETVVAETPTEDVAPPAINEAIESDPDDAIHTPLAPAAALGPELIEMTVDLSELISEN